MQFSHGILCVLNTGEAAEVVVPSSLGYNANHRVKSHVNTTPSGKSPYENEARRARIRCFDDTSDDISTVAITR